MNCSLENILGLEVREMISTLTGQLANIQRTTQKAGNPSNANNEEVENGVGIVTLVGSNVGATMRGSMEEKTSPQDAEGEEFTTCVNGNFQAINNSIMLGGSYSTNDPGIHLKISDNLQHDSVSKMGKKKEKGGSTTDQQTA